VSEEAEDYDLPITDDGPTEDVEIEVTEDDLGENLADFGDPDEAEDDDNGEVEVEAEPEEEAEEEEEEPEEEPKPKRRDENRIQELARRAQEAERRASEYEARAQQEAELRRQSDIAMMSHYETGLRSKEKTIRAELSEAMSLGDTEKQIDLQTELMQVRNDLLGVSEWRKEAEREPVAPVQPTAQPETQQPTLEPRTRDWIASNTWFQPQSPDFDREMHEEATTYARKLERRLKADGRAEEIGSKSYFADIDKYVRQEFPEAFEEAAAPKKGTPKMSRDTTVAPVARSGAPGQPTNSRMVRLTPEQRRMAHNMADSGAYKKQNGQRMTHSEAEKYHATFILKQNRK
jgi:hypothetical protein